RFGVMRSREFIMKDAYSFDATDEAADKSYWAMYEAYNRIFERCGLEFRAVLADTGNIGGSFSHEFMVLAPTGEDIIMSSTDCDYAANLELAEIGVSDNEKEKERPQKDLKPINEVSTPGMKTVEEVAKFLNGSDGDLIKTLIIQTDTEPVAALVRGDAELSLTKLRKVLGAEYVELSTPDVIQEVTGGPMGFSGPVGLKKKIKVIADKSVRNIQNAITGANKADMHITGVNPGRDFEADLYADIRVARDGDPCPQSNGTLVSTRGIEVGHVFKLGTKYSEAMNATFSDIDGKEKPFIMGCYGIGIGRTVAAAIEQGNDEAGIKFPLSIAPFEVTLIPTNMKNENVKTISDDIYSALKAIGVDVLIDDRGESAGIKFKDAELTGIPIRITVGPRTLENGEVEIKTRMDNESRNVKIEEVVSEVEKLLL
ncbi:MAG: proline--tRNA ligase, partial [Thermodesulfobacteriota bacterium]